MDLGNIFFNTWDSLLDALYQINLYKKQDKGLQCTAKVIEDNGNITSYKSLISESREFIYTPALKRVDFYPKIYKEQGLQVVLLPDKSHGNLDYTMFKKLALAQTYDVLLKWKHGRKFVSTKVLKCTGTIDMSIFNNNLSPKFSRDANQILQSKALKFLEEYSNTKFIMAMIISALFGFVFGGITFTLLVKLI